VRWRERQFHGVYVRAVEIVAVGVVHDADPGVAEDAGGGCRSGDQHQERHHHRRT
jgi:hypothetical protein